MILAFSATFSGVGSLRLLPLIAKRMADLVEAVGGRRSFNRIFIIAKGRSDVWASLRGVFNNKWLFGSF
jgi:hypothetical protein